MVKPADREDLVHDAALTPRPPGGRRFGFIFEAVIRARKPALEM